MKKSNIFAWLIPILAVAAAGIVFVVIYINSVYLNAPVSSAYSLTLPKELSVGLKEAYTLSPELAVTNPNMVNRTARRVRESRFEYESSDTSVLSVDSEGKLILKKAGTATVSVHFGDLSATVLIHTYMEVAGIRFDTDGYTMNVGEFRMTQLIVTPKNADYEPHPTYESMNPRVCTVDADGKISAVGPGKTTVAMADGGFSDSVTVEVLAPLEKISLNATELTLNQDETYTFLVQFTPKNTTEDTTVTFSSSDEKVGKIDESGVFTALSGGETTVMAVAGRHLALCRVKVEVPLKEIRFPVEELTIKDGNVLTIPVTFNPPNTTDDCTLSWKSSDNSVLTVNADGQIRAVGPGTARVTASALDGTIFAEIRISVLVPVRAVLISETKVTINKGETKKLSASLFPANTTESKYINWASDNINVVTVENGVLKAVGAGTAHVTAYHDDFSAVCTVTVKSPVTSIEFEQKSFTLIETFSAPLAVTFFPADTTGEKTVTYSTDDTSVAVIENGKLVAKKEGTCHVIARDLYGHEARATVTVTPYIHVSSVTVSPASIVFEHQGDTVQLAATVLPENAVQKSVSYSSSDSNVATVSENGLVRAVGEGTCTITASSGGKTATVGVSVPEADIIVVLDPGHDGSHTGAISHFTPLTIHEEVITLQTAKACKAYLESHYYRVKVYLTRNDGACPDTGRAGQEGYAPFNPAAPTASDLENRVNYAQKMGAAVLVSLHYNDEGSKTCLEDYKASYCCTFISQDSQNEQLHNIHQRSVALSNSILKYVSALGIKSEGPKTWKSDTYFDEFGNSLDYNAINRHSATRGIVGIIVEHCFMTGDYAYVSDPDMIDAFGVADAKGIAEYLGLQEKK